MGSGLIISLAKIGVKKIKIIDYDTVSPHNYSNQIFGKKHFGRKKVDCIKELCDFLGLDGDFEFIDAKVDEEYEIADYLVKDQVIIMAVDSMEARKVIFDQASLLGNGLLIDCRIGKSKATGFTLKLGNALQLKAFEKFYMFKDTDPDAEQASCTEKTYKGVADWVNQYVVNSVWAYFVTDLKEYSQSVNIDCATQRTSYVKF